MAAKVRYLSHNEYNEYCTRKLAAYNEWLLNPKRPIGVPYQGFSEDKEFITMQAVPSVMGSMAATLTGEQVIPESAKPEAKRKAKAEKVAKPKAVRKAKSGTKAEKAVEIFKRVGGEKAAVIAAFMAELEMSTAGATTYFYNTKKLV